MPDHAFNKYSIFLDHPNACVPTYANESAAGLDLTLVDVVAAPDGNQAHDVVWFTTGVHIVPLPEYYFEVHPRSSLSKSGWSLANSTGIIDPDYRGAILVALRRHQAPLSTLWGVVTDSFARMLKIVGLNEWSGGIHDDTTPKIPSLPWKACQLVPRRHYRITGEPTVMEREEFYENFSTRRGDGGYGSTDK